MGKLLDVPLSELREIFAQEEVAHINKHQEQTMKQTPTSDEENEATKQIPISEIVWERFMPKPNTPEEEEKYLVLQQNVTEFDDEIEDEVAEDPTLRTIIEARARMPNDADVINAFRARRCIVALGIVYAEIDVEQVA